MPQIIDISEWSPQPWFNTGGTREKKMVLSPDGHLYYFKQSIKKYPYEFWSEIIAYEIGKMLGFDVLRYDIAIDREKIGCVCKSMIDSEAQELVEGGKYLSSFDNTFAYEDKKPAERYNYELIDSTFEAFKLKDKEKLIETFVLDAIISNGDRHQENWAFIIEHGRLSKAISDMEYDFKMDKLANLSPRLKKFLEWVYTQKGKKTLKPSLIKVKLSINDNQKLSPIYDSGSSLGRELTNDKVKSMLKDSVQFEAFLNRGKSEIHWNNKKISHFDFIENLKATDAETITKILDRVKQNFNHKELGRILDNVDAEVPETFINNRIPKERKELILKLVTSRIERLYRGKK